MLPTSLEEIARGTGGSLRGRRASQVWEVCTDSRKAVPGALFVALKGPHFDGHDHALRAIAKGAVAALVARGRIPTDAPGSYVEVEDPLSAMGRLAGAYRGRLKARIVGITGSNGKTTTKEMLSAICAASGSTIRSPKSYNNNIGLPLTCFHLGEYTKYGVLEMGANAPGELAALAAIAQPDIAVVTNVGRAHLGGFGGTLAHVAAAKGELVEAVAKRGGIVILNGDDPNSAPLFERAKGATQVIRFGLTLADRIPALEGAHTVMNALAAIAAARALGISEEKIQEGLEDYEAPPMRLEETGVAGVRLVNDAYNANPDSMAAGLSWLASQSGRKIACLGEMLELGEESRTLHRELGKAACFVDLLVCVGEAGRWIAEGYGKKAVCVADAAEAGAILAGMAKPGDVILFKASRGSALERAFEACRDGLKKART